MWFPRRVALADALLPRLSHYFARGANSNAVWFKGAVRIDIHSDIRVSTLR